MSMLDRKLLRGITVHDTTLTSYREVRESGSGETYARPPGRLFVVDGQVFVLFDVMLRSLHGKMIGQRPLSVVVLSEPRDSVMEILFMPGAMDTLRMNGNGTARLYGDAGNDVFFGGGGGAVTLNLATAGLETVWGSVVGDTTTTMMWLDGVDPLDVVARIGFGVAELLRLGRSVTDIRHIVLTHAHKSHLGGLAALQGKGDVYLLAATLRPVDGILLVASGPASGDGVHLAAAGHPVLGDMLYGPAGPAARAMTAATPPPWASSRL